jgi:acyl-CoA reductase-like NAD-dependent aldehyde dehydrogenase
MKLACCFARVSRQEQNMSVLTFGSVMAATARPTVTPAASKTNSAADNFLAYMKESPAERMADSWLAAHGLSKAKLAAMTPEQRDAVLKQMAKEITDQVAQAAQQKTDKKTTAL